MRALPNGVSGITGTVRERCGHKPGQGRPQFRQLNPIGPGPLYCIEHVGSTSTKDLRFDKYSFCQDCTRKYLSASFTLRGSLVITFAGLASVDPHPSFSIDLIVETKKRVQSLSVWQSGYGRGLVTWTACSFFRLSCQREGRRSETEPVSFISLRSNEMTGGGTGLRRRGAEGLSFSFALLEIETHFEHLFPVFAISLVLLVKTLYAKSPRKRC